VSTDIRGSDKSLQDRLQLMLGVDVPDNVGAHLDRRVHASITAEVTRRRAVQPGPRRWPRRRIVAGLAIAALVATAASPVIEFFEGWHSEYDAVFALSTPIDQSVTDEGYRVTVVHAYADPFTVRLAIAAEDLEDRGWSEIAVGSPTVTDEVGRVYPMSEGHYDAQERTSSEGWLIFTVPADATEPGVRHLMVAFDNLAVRLNAAPTLANGDPDFDRIWTSVAGTWSFEFDLEFLPGHGAMPGLASTVGDVTVTLDELTVTPAATVGRIRVVGLRPVDWGWDPHIRIEHDGQDVTIHSMTGTIQGLQQDAPQDIVVFGGAPGFDDLSGTWTITIDQFHRDIYDPETGEGTGGESIVGPWVLTFEGPAADEP